MTCKRCSDGEATYCISCMNDIMTETDKALERAEARIVKLRACLFCGECGGTGMADIKFRAERIAEHEQCFITWNPCPICGPLREQSRKEGE